MTIGVYACVTPGQRDGWRLLEACRRSAGEREAETELFVDIDRGRRDQFQRLRETVRAGEVDAVLAGDATHVGGDPGTVAEFVAHCYEHGVAFEVLDGSFPTVEPDGERADGCAALMRWMADASDALLRERVRSGIERAERAGKWTGRPPYGFTLADGRLAVDPADYLRMGAALKLLERSDMSLSTVARHADIPKSSLSRVRNDPERRRLYFGGGGDAVAESDEGRWRSERDETIVETSEEVYATDDRQEKGQLRRERDFVERLLEMSPIGIVTIDPDGEITRANEHAVEIVGLAESEMLDRSATESEWTIYDGEGNDISNGLVPIQRVLETGEAQYDNEVVLERPDGERRWFAGNVAPIRSPDGDVEQIIAAWQDVTERKRSELELKRYRTLVEASPDAMFALDSQLRMAHVNGAVEALAGLDRAELLGQPASIFLEEGVFDEEAFESGIETVRSLITAETPTSETFELVLHGSEGDMETEVHVASAPETDGVVGVVRDISERKRTERELQRQRDEVETLNRINELIQEVRRRFLGAATRAEIEEGVCRSLVASDLYSVSWVGELDVTREEVTLRTGAGLDDAARRLVEAGRGNPGERPAVRTIKTGETCTSKGENDLNCGGNLRSEASALGIESMIWVPLVRDETVYGTLVVCSPRPDGFSEREQAAFEVLGETIGLTIHSVETRQLLLTDRVTELAFEGRDVDAFFVDLSERLSCRCTLDGLAPSTDGTLLHFVTVEDADPARVLELTEQSATIEECRLVESGDRSSRLEMRMGESAPKTLVQAGASVRNTTADGGTLEIIADVAPEATIRAVVEAFTDAYPEMELVRKEERERPLQTAKKFRSELTGQLTDRQLAAIQAAYYAGYFDWPRDSTAEEVAHSMDIASPTLHRHLRKATQTLLAAFFEDEETS